MKFIPPALVLLLMLLVITPARAHEGLSENAIIAQITPEEKEAMEEVSDELIEISTPSGEVIEEKTSTNYTLAYPGMLPDHPLYFLKSLRDSIIGVLISDSVKKGEFNLLNADKQINSAQFLIDNKKDDLAADSIEKAHLHMQAALTELEKAKAQKKDYAPLRDRMKSATEKHLEFVANLKLSMAQEYHSILTKYETYLKQTHQTLTEIK